MRELREELGVVPAHLPARPWRRLREGDEELLIWVVTTWSGTVSNRAPEEHAELRWFRHPETVGLDFPHPVHPELIADAFAAAAAAAAAADQRGVSRP